MKLSIFIMTLFLSAISKADVLAENAFARLEYQEVAIFDIQAVTSKIKYVPASPTNVAYYEGQIIVTALVEGNICSASSSTFGTMNVKEANLVYTKLIAGNLSSTQPQGCPQFSSPRRVSFPISISWLVDNGSGINQSVANFKVNQMGLRLVSILMKARKNQIQVTIRK